MSIGLRVTKEILDYIFNNQSLSAISNVYVSLHTASPGEDGQTAGEVSGGNYARVQTGPSDWEAAGGTNDANLQNSSAITFPQASASWGTITYAGFWTHLTETGEAYFLGSTSLTASVAVASGDTPQFPIQSITVSLD